MTGRVGRAGTSPFAGWPSTRLVTMASWTARLRPLNADALPSVSPSVLGEPLDQGGLGLRELAVGQGDPALGAEDQGQLVRWE